MKKTKPTPAEKMRRHRQIFEHALAHGLTLIEAEKALAREEWQAAQDRLRVVTMCGRQTGKTAATDAALSAAADAGFRVIDGRRPIPADAPWMMRD